ncbi:MAG: ABC transporter substrate-binding protein [Kiloniellales bacterium]
MSRPSNATTLAVSAHMPSLGVQRRRSVKVGVLAPLSGEVSAWGQPGRDGCLIWADWINARGGIRVGEQRLNVEIVSFDDRYDPARALVGARKLILEDDVRLIMMLGGDTFPAVQSFVNRHKMLVTTLLPSDLSPDTPYLIAPCEVHPIYNVTGVEWLRESRPELKTAALCAQEDSLGLPSVATYRAAFEAAGIELVKEVLFSGATDDMEPVVRAMLEDRPDILCWDTAYEPFVHALTECAFRLGFKGQILSCTADNYPELLRRTSPEFMEGFVFQFPDFDDEALNQPTVNFTRPNEFYTEYNLRFPGTWSAVSWEYYAILEQWREAVEAARTVEPVTVLAAMKAGGVGRHVFGDARWWGKELFGINHALVGNWPVVRIENGKARIVAFKSIPQWWDRHGPLLVKHMRALGQMWDQRPRLLPRAG